MGETACKSCGSINTIKIGKTITKNGPVQRYRCKDCYVTYASEKGTPVQAEAK